MEAKEIVPLKFWILEDAGVKVGTVSAAPTGIKAVVNSQSHVFDSWEAFQAQFDVKLGKLAEKKEEPKGSMEVYGYPTAHEPFNGVWHMPQGLPIYTKTAKSSSYHCAGYYVIKFENGWVRSFCPKKSTLEGNQYVGPMKSEIECRLQLTKQKK